MRYYAYVLIRIDEQNMSPLEAEFVQILPVQIRLLFLFTTGLLNDKLWMGGGLGNLPREWNVNSPEPEQSSDKANSINRPEKLLTELIYYGLTNGSFPSDPRLTGVSRLSNN